MVIDNEYTEIDCPWFDAEWASDHPDFPIIPMGCSSPSRERQGDAA